MEKIIIVKESAGHVKTFEAILFKKKKHSMLTQIFKTFR